MKMGLSRKGVQILYFLNFFPNWANFFDIVAVMGAFLICQSQKNCQTFFEPKTDIVWVKNGNFCCFDHFQPKNGCFWSKKCLKGLLTLAYQKSTHQCYNIQKNQPNWVKNKKYSPKAFVFPSMKGPFSCILKFQSLKSSQALKILTNI